MVKSVLFIFEYYIYNVYAVRVRRKLPRRRLQLPGWLGRKGRRLSRSCRRRRR